MAYQKTDGTLQDAEYIVGRLIEGFSFEEAIQGMKMPIDDGTPERPGWCWRNKQLLISWASAGGVPANRGMTTPNKRVVTYLADHTGKMWAIHPDNTRTEVVAPAVQKEAVVANANPELHADSVPMVETDIPKEAKRSRRKQSTKLKEW